MEALPQVLVNVRVKKRTELSDIPGASEIIKKVEESLGDEGRVLIRYSGTEPLLRIMLEGTDQGQIETMADEIAATIRNEIGA